MDEWGEWVAMCQRTQYERSWARAATHALVSCNWRGRGGSMIRDHWPRSADVLEVWRRMELKQGPRGVVQGRLSHIVCKLPVIHDGIRQHATITRVRAVLPCVRSQSCTRSNSLDHLSRARANSPQNRTIGVSCALEWHACMWCYRNSLYIIMLLHWRVL